MLPNFLIIGAQKAGTTFIQKCAREHPDVFSPAKEVRFFEDPDYLQTDFKQFEALFDKVSHEKAIGIKRPDYLARPECPERIYRHLPQAKLILVLRNPVERALSAYFHQMTRGFLPIKSAEEGLMKIVKGDYKEAYPKSAEIIEYGFYHHYLARYLNYFDREQLCIILFEAMKKDPFETMKRIYNFIGVNDHYIPPSLSLKRKHNSSIYSLTRLKLLTLSNPFIYTYNSTRTKVVQKQAHLWSKAIGETIAWLDKVSLKLICSNHKPQLSPELAESLYKIYEEDVNKLEVLLGQSLGQWKPNPSKPVTPEVLSFPLAASADYQYSSVSSE
jgi:hypothetical protein